jgi:hypothetical protein
MSIDKAKKPVENVDGWKEARDFVERRIKNFKFSLCLIKKTIADDVPWLNYNNSEEYLVTRK